MEISIKYPPFSNPYKEESNFLQELFSQGFLASLPIDNSARVFRKGTFAWKFPYNVRLFFNLYKEETNFFQGRVSQGFLAFSMQIDAFSEPKNRFNFFCVLHFLRRYLASYVFMIHVTLSV